jgi:hypothetical protein
VALPSFTVFAGLKSVKNALFRGDPRVLGDAAMAFGEAVSELPESLRQRREIQSLRVTPKDVFLGLR